MNDDPRVMTHRTSIASRTLALLITASLAACTGGTTPTDAMVGADIATTDVHASTDVASDGTNPTDSGVDATDTTAPIDVSSSDDVTTPTDVPTASDVSDVSAMDAGACGTTSVAPDLNGSNACMTLDFGQPAAMVQNVASPITFTGGTIPPGIYDIVSYSRTTGSIMTTIRATLVVASDGHFTEVRVLDTGNGTPPTTRKSGMWHIESTSFVRDVSCGGSDAGFETNRLSYSVECNGTETLLHMGLTNLWFTYRRR